MDSPPRFSSANLEDIKLAETWLDWAQRLPQVDKIDMETLSAALVRSANSTVALRMNVDPATLRAAYPRLVNEAEAFWPALGNDMEAAWRMLSIALEECVDSIGADVIVVSLQIGRVVGFVASKADG